MSEVPGRAEAEAKYGPKLPSAVRAQVDAAETIINQTTQPPPSESHTDGAPPEQPLAVQPAAPSHSAPPAGDMPDWEQRARSAEGRLNALMAQSHTQAERMEQMERLLASMQARGVQQPQPETQEAIEFERLITEDEERDYGKDMLDVVGRRTAEVVAPEFYQLNQRLQQIEGRLNGATTILAQNETRGVFQTLQENIGPQWNEINHHPAFHAWLDQIEGYAGVPRRQLLVEAFDRHDAPRVLRFFQGFLEANGTPPNQQPRPSPAQTSGNGKVPLEAFAAPGRARSEPQSLAPDKPTYTRAQMQKFWDDRRRGLWRGREADADAIEADIFRAQHEGRIR